jgi:hypothetical protein
MFNQGETLFYSGNFRKGVIQGEGKLFFKDGTYYQGNF